MYSVYTMHFEETSIYNMIEAVRLVADELQSFDAWPSWSERNSPIILSHDIGYLIMY